MKTKLFFATVLLLTISAFVSDLNAQYVGDKTEQTEEPDRDVYEVTLKTGKTYHGILLVNKYTEINGYVIIQFEDETTLQISSQMIKRIRKLKPSELSPTAFGFSNPNPEVYLMGNSAFMPYKNEGVFHLNTILVPTVQYGLTDWFSLTAGADLLFSTITLVLGDVMPFTFIRPKIGYNLSEDFRVSFAPTIGTFPSFIPEGIESFTHLAAHATYGNKDNNITFTINQIRNNFIDDVVVLRNAGIMGTVRAGKNISLLGEFWTTGLATPNNQYSFGGGLRILGKRYKLDLGFYTTPELVALGRTDDFPIFLGLPQINLGFSF